MREIEYFKDKAIRQYCQLHDIAFDDCGIVKQVFNAVLMYKNGNDVYESLKDNINICLKFKLFTNKLAFDEDNNIHYVVTYNQSVIDCVSDLRAVMTYLSNRW